MTETRRKLCGWGYEGQGLTASEAEAFRAQAEERFGVPIEPRAGVPQVADFELRAPRLAPPASMGELFRDDPYERLLHAYGKSFPDAVRMFRREVPEPPDLVAYPETTDDVVRILDWAGDAGAAAIPFGGGSSVVGGVEPAVGDSYAGARRASSTRPWAAGSRPAQAAISPASTPTSTTSSRRRRP